jgi:hypothetical protein
VHPQYLFCQPTSSNISLNAHKSTMMIDTTTDKLTCSALIDLLCCNPKDR